MDALARTEIVSGWSLGFAANDDEPRMRDLDLAERLGFARPAKIRDLIKRLVRDGKLSETEVFTTTGKTSRVGGRPAEESWLSQKGTLKVIAKSDTVKADEVLDEVFDVYLAWRSGRLAGSQSDAAQRAVLALSAGGAALSTNLHFAGECRTFIRRLAEVSGWTFNMYPLAKEWLIQRVMSPLTPPALVAARAQLELFGRAA